MFSYSTSYNQKHHQSVYFNWRLSWSILKNVHPHLKTPNLDKDDRYLLCYSSPVVPIKTCLTLLDLSAAFDTINHSILFEYFSSWFGISSTVALTWIRSYLLNRSFYLNKENCKSSVFQQRNCCSRTCSWSSSLHLIYHSSKNCHISFMANHHIYADDTQLLLLFSALDFSHRINHLENTIANISNWISADFLSHNFTKTDILIFDLPQQISKFNCLNYHSCT